MIKIENFLTSISNSKTILGDIKTKFAHLTTLNSALNIDYDIHDKGNENRKNLVKNTIFDNIDFIKQTIKNTIENNNLQAQYNEYTEKTNIKNAENEVKKIFSNLNPQKTLTDDLMRLNSKDSSFEISYKNNTSEPEIQLIKPNVPSEIILKSIESIHQSVNTKLNDLFSQTISDEESKKITDYNKLSDDKKKLDSYINDLFKNEYLILGDDLLIQYIDSNLAKNEELYRTFNTKDDSENDISFYDFIEKEKQEITKLQNEFLKEKFKDENEFKTKYKQHNDALKNIFIKLNDNVFNKNLFNELTNKVNDITFTTEQEKAIEELKSTISSSEESGILGTIKSFVNNNIIGKKDEPTSSIIDKKAGTQMNFFNFNDLVNKGGVNSSVKFTEIYDKEKKTLVNNLVFTFDKSPNQELYFDLKNICNATKKSPNFSGMPIILNFNNKDNPKESGFIKIKNTLNSAGGDLLNIQMRGNGSYIELKGPKLKGIEQSKLSKPINSVFIMEKNGSLAFFDNDLMEIKDKYVLDIIKTNVKPSTMSINGKDINALAENISKNLSTPSSLMNSIGAGAKPTPTVTK